MNQTTLLRRIHMLRMAMIVGAAVVVAFGPSAAVAFEPQEANEVVDLSFDDIKFDIEPDQPFERDMLTDEIRDLIGKTIKIRGYIRPSFQQDGIRTFVLVRDNQECCFGPGAALYDCILVKMAGDKTTSFTIRPVAVEGRLILKEFEGPDGKLWAIYRMIANEVN